jgi:hypothetical protein
VKAMRSGSERLKTGANNPHLRRNDTDIIGVDWVTTWSGTLNLRSLLCVEDFEALEAASCQAAYGFADSVEELPKR